MLKNILVTVLNVGNLVMLKSWWVTMLKNIYYA